MKKFSKMLFLVVVLPLLAGCSGTIYRPQEIRAVSITPAPAKEGKRAFCLFLDDTDRGYQGVSIWVTNPPSMSYSYAICYKDGTNEWKPLE